MSPPTPSTRLRLIVAVLAAFLLAVPLTVAVVEDSATHDKSITVTLGGPGHKKVTLPPAAQDTAASQRAEDARGAEQLAHSDLRTEVALSPDEIAHNDAERIPGSPRIPALVPLAAQSIPGCRTLPVRNNSSRQGAPILGFTFHFTVSRDSGWAGVLGNVRWFDTDAASASSTYIVDRRIGACALTVPENLKAWAQAAYNRWMLSLEVTADGREGAYLPPGRGRQKVLYLMHRAHRVYKIPYRHGVAAGGRIIRTGFFMHADLGLPGGGHVDVRPYGIDDLIAEAARTDPSTAKPRPRPITSTARVRCRKINWWRTHGRPHGVPERHAVYRRRVLMRHGVTCTARGPVSR